MHSTTVPNINSDKCYYCRKCLHQCPVGAIFVSGRHIEIDPSLCVNCGKCVDIAKYGGISYEWNASPEHFQNMIGKYSNAIFQKFKNKSIFCNFIPKDDSYSGIMISRDPLAIDLATHQFIERDKGIKLPLDTLINHCIKNKIGNPNFDLEIINY